MKVYAHTDLVFFSFFYLNIGMNWNDSTLCVINQMSKSHRIPARLYDGNNGLKYMYGILCWRTLLIAVITKKKRKRNQPNQHNKPENTNNLARNETEIIWERMRHLIFYGRKKKLNILSKTK